jgi:hypothetical protein
MKEIMFLEAKHDGYTNQTAIQWNSPSFPKQQPKLSVVLE